ncbi:MAG: serine hydrolase domain-containing protein [Herpetosiphon sp.]
MDVIFDFGDVGAQLEAVVPKRCPAAQLVVRVDNQVVYDRAFGWLDPESRRVAVERSTLFDLASVTKLFVAATFMTLVDDGSVTLDQPVSTVLPPFSGRRTIEAYEDPLMPARMVPVDAPGSTVDVGTITFRQLLTHTSGMPPWRPLFRQRDRSAARALAMGTNWAFVPGTRVVYSDLALIVLGTAIEVLTGEGLEEAIAQHVTGPLGLKRTQFLMPDPNMASGRSVAPTEYCAWRGRRVHGEVHDENAAFLGGISGHAGLFSTAGDVARFGQVFLDGGAPILRHATVQTMVSLQASDDTLRRGLGFVLWTAEPDGSGYAFDATAFGHTGFTGTSLWVDPRRSLVVALLTNEVYYGRQERIIGHLRTMVHSAVVAAVDHATGTVVGGRGV